MKDQRLYCQDILERITMLEQFTQEGKDAFLSSQMIQESVVRCFEVIGEIIKRLDSNIIAQYSSVDWKGLAGFRDVLIHQYDKVDMTLTWEFFEDDIPPLKKAMTDFLSNK
ncbi:MAG: HepT-like ribonuclease domain-containing protein [bacterium]|nr:HepT-like ribonuclease domain-containing protein [bacterium]